MCPQCKGRRKIVVQMRISEGSDAMIGVEATCPTCQGTGDVDNPNVCTKCNGSKTMFVQTKLSNDSSGTIGVEVDCDACNGDGTREAQLAIEAKQIST